VTWQPQLGHFIEVVSEDEAARTRAISDCTVASIADGADKVSQRMKAHHARRENTQGDEDVSR
jgi:hypothetical protein